MLAGAFERVLQCEAVHDRGEHPHEVGLRLVHALAGTLDAAPEVAATDDDGDVDVQFLAGLAHFLRHLREDRVVETETGRFSKCLARELQHHA